MPGRTREYVHPDLQFLICDFDAAALVWASAKLAAPASANRDAEWCTNCMGVRIEPS
jgi:hypothetical protein